MNLLHSDRNPCPIRRRLAILLFGVCGCAGETTPPSGVRAKYHVIHYIGGNLNHRDYWTMEEPRAWQGLLHFKDVETGQNIAISGTIEITENP